MFIKALGNAELVAPGASPVAAGQQVVIPSHTLEENLRFLYSNDPALQYRATQQFRRLLSIGT